MLLSTFARAGIVAAVAACFAVPASAALAVKTSHPYLFATADDVAKVLGALPRVSSFPALGGKIAFKFTPVPRAGKDWEEADIFGDAKAPGRSILIRYLKDQSPGMVTLQIGLRDSDRNGFIAVSKVDLPVNHETSISLTWDSAKGDASLHINESKVSTFAWLKDGSGKPVDWHAAAQDFTFHGHRGDVIKQFKLSSLDGTTLWEAENVDIELSSAWATLLANADRHAADVAECIKSAVPVEAPKICAVHKEGRAEIVNPARTLALAYYVTKKPAYLQGARDHIELIRRTALGAGIEWSMSSRVGALGLYYDWFNKAFTDLPNGSAYLASIAKLIKDTIAHDTPDFHDDLRFAICGSDILNDQTFNCNGEVWLEGQSNVPRYYLAGHPQSAQFNSLLGLLAIHPVEPGVGGMIDTIFQHYKEGFLPVRQSVSPNGGHHSLFSYNSSSLELADRLKVWQRALDGDEASELKADFLASAIYPYIYGLRHDDTFPATGDNFQTSVGSSQIGVVALAAQDPVAYGFYQSKVLRDRRMRDEGYFWERLLYPERPGETSSVEGLPLSRYFNVAGNVLIRDTWNYPEATLLDFKSTSYISENHQHLDQNSFSLNYKAPLLIDSGQYDDYLSSHWKSYYQRTIAHNSIVLFDQNEQFIYPDGPEPWSNDGGQWYNGRALYPTPSEIATPLKNGLDGVQAYYDGVSYVYVAGNASKAYGPKLDQSSGFKRSIVYLRGPKADAGAAQIPPTILIFDNLLTTAGERPTSLLHMVNKPVVGGSIASGTSGRYALSEAANNASITVRNGNGMVTIQPLLPESRETTLVGGKDSGGECEQVKLENKEFKKLGKSGDCRFLVRYGNAGSGYAWGNFAPENKGYASSPDIGAWRLEIQPKLAVPVGTRQYFLNALHVADNDFKDEVAAAHQNVKLLKRHYESYSVKVREEVIVVFNGGPTELTTFAWEPLTFTGKTLLFGARKKACYTLLVEGTTLKMVLSDTGHYSANAEGVLDFDTSKPAPARCGT
ncbi:heparinase II/III domain-containing protein [Pseudoduganella umbonata]|uniref:Heparinase II/III-like C-terminal domain-containing protein n=1 Tax=Pseudoduganella umbonata TaxID=864828 RepID=A0A4P8HP62_9BURK|nr:heparinase II/III family protein [Pseudoduganella umbonata]MBB3221075.1 hypothetical protein [Pseudoduganella umbonata]QCP10272.1 hypothetical protein FCL38_07420 [Pseudoduganella umbonata]